MRTAYNFGALDAGAQSLEATRTKLMADIADLEAAVAPMLSIWEGEAREAYYQLQTVWRGVGEDVGVFVNAVKDGVVTANELAQMAETANRNRFAV